MRIRQVKPAFWTDRVVARMTYPARLFYVGLWCVADDAGWLTWDLDELGALLFPYEQPTKRNRHLSAWTDELTASGRVKLLDCGCAIIPTLENHQKQSGGNRSFAGRTHHENVCRQYGKVRTSTDKDVLSVSTDKSVLVPEKVAGRVGNGRERKGNSAQARDDQDQGSTTTSEFRRLVPMPGRTA